MPKIKNKTKTLKSPKTPVIKNIGKKMSMLKKKEKYWMK